MGFIYDVLCFNDIQLHVAMTLENSVKDNLSS